MVAKLEIPFVAEKQVRGSMGKVEYTWSEVLIFKAQNRNPWILLTPYTTISSAQQN